MLHLQLELSGSGMAYEAGDALGVVPVNSDALVRALLQRLSLSTEAVFSVQSVSSTGKVSGYEINGPIVVEEEGSIFHFPR